MFLQTIYIKWEQEVLFKSSLVGAKLENIKITQMLYDIKFQTE